MKRNGGKFAWQQNNCSKKYIFQDNVLNYYNEPEGEDKTHIQSEFMQPHGAVKDQHIEEEGKENIFDLDLELTGYSTNPMEHSLLEDTHLLLDDTHLLLEMNDDFQETVLPDLFQEDFSLPVERTPIEFSKYRGMNPYKCWKLYFDTAVMKQSDYEWCCILEQYLEDYLSNTAFLNEEDILRDAIFDFNLDSFIEYYGKFQFTFEEESVQLPERWLIDLLGFSKCLLVTVTEAIYRQRQQEEQLKGNSSGPIPIQKLAVNFLATSSSVPHIQKDLKPGSNMIGKSVVFEGKLMAFDKYVAYNEFIWDCQQRRGGCQRQTCTLTADSYKKGCQHCGLKNTLIINYQETKVHLKYKLYFEGGLVGDCSASRNLTINTNYRLFGVVQVPGNIVSGLVQVPDSYQSGSKRADFVDLFIEGYSLQALTIQEELASNSRVQVKENLFERLVCGFCPGLTGKDLLKAFLLLVALARRPFKVLLIGDPSTGKSLIGEELVKLSQYTGFPCKLLNDIQSTCKLPFQLLCTLAKYSNEFLICTATPLQGHFNHSKSLAENLGWPEDQFVNIHFDACLFFKDDSKNIYGDILLAEYILSIHGSTTGTSLSKRRRTSQNLLGGQCTEKRGSSFVERLVRFQKENDHFVTALHSSDMQELITNFPSVKKCVLSAQVYHGILEKNYKLKDIPWLVDLIKAKCLLEDRLVTDLTDLQDIDEIFTFMQEILPKVSGSSCPSSVKGAKAPKGKSGQLKAFVAMLDKGQIMAEATLKELAESLALDIVLTNWNQILDSLNQQGILLKASGDQYKVL